MNTGRHYIDQGSLNVYGAILVYKLNNRGVSPSIPELVEATGYNSTKPINDRLADLEREAVIARIAGTPRSIEVAGGEWSGPSKPKGLTPRQSQVWAIIIRHARKHDGNPPTLKDLGEALHLSSDSTARYHVEALIEKGLLTKNGGSHRSIRVVGATYTVDLDRVPDSVRDTASAMLAEFLSGIAMGQTAKYTKRKDHGLGVI